MPDRYPKHRRPAAITPAFMLPRKGPVTAGERAALVLPAPPPPRRPRPGPTDASRGGGR